MKHYLHLSLLVSIAAQASAQQIIETFTYPNSATVPGWTPRSGSWTITNNRLVKTQTASTQYITLDGVTALNCVVQAEIFYGAFNGLQLGGVAARHSGTSATTPVVYAKLQDNNSTTGYDLDIAYLYENSSATSTAVTPPILSGILRLTVLDNTATMQVDTNKDGIFDLSVTRTLTAVLGAGAIGCVAYNNTEIDNFKYFDGVLAQKSLPKIGTTYNMRFATPVTTPTPWIAAFSLANTGIPLGARAIPLSLDPLLDLTLGNAGALGLSGLTDAAGDGTLAFPIPNSPALVGFPFHAAAFTVDGSKPYSIGVISQDVRVVIQA